MSILDRQEIFIGHFHLSGAQWGQPARDPLDERVAAVAASGATGMGFDVDDLDTILTDRSADDIRAVLDHHGVQAGDLEVLLGWHLDPGENENSATLEARMYALAGALGAPRIKMSAVIMPQNLPPVELLAERYAAVCDRAAEHGIDAALEPIAIFPGFDYRVASQVVALADRPNGGLLIDAWHFFRDPKHLEVLEQIEARHVVGFELCDGFAEPQGTLIEDAIDHRVLPGQGAFDLPHVLRVLDRKGVDTPLSVEVLSDQLRELPARENAELTVSTIRSFMATVSASVLSA